MALPRKPPGRKLSRTDNPAKETLVRSKLGHWNSVYWRVETEWPRSVLTHAVSSVPAGPALCAVDPLHVEVIQSAPPRAIAAGLAVFKDGTTWNMSKKRGVQVSTGCMISCTREELCTFSGPCVNEGLLDLDRCRSPFLGNARVTRIQCEEGGENQLSS